MEHEGEISAKGRIPLEYDQPVLLPSGWTAVCEKTIDPPSRLMVQNLSLIAPARAYLEYGGRNASLMLNAGATGSKTLALAGGPLAVTNASAEASLRVTLTAE
jgi:hypothetical protein